MASIASHMHNSIVAAEYAIQQDYEAYLTAKNDLINKKRLMKESCAKYPSVIQEKRR